MSRSLSVPTDPTGDARREVGTPSHGRAATPRRGKRRHGRGNQGWVPNQHGAWAMVVIPWLLGTWLRFHEGRPDTYALVLGAFWLAGYFAFHAASVWLRSHRQRRYLRPVVTYGAVAGVLGLATQALAGPALAWWAVPFVPVLVVALALAASRHERALVGGLLTVAAASLLVLVAAYESPALVPGSDGTGVALALVCLGYFGGTVFFVKSMIRERGNAAFLALSVGWHVAVLAAAAIAATLTGFSWAWTGFFGAVAVRALLLPLVGPMRPGGRRFTPKQLGIAEAAFSAVLIALALVTA